MSNQCEHGHLRRVCEICQRDDEIKQLKAERDAISAELRQEKLLSYREHADKVEAERDAAVAVLETVLRIPDMSDADLEQLRTNCKAAIDAARGEK